MIPFRFAHTISVESIASLMEREIVTLMSKSICRYYHIIFYIIILGFNKFMNMSKITEGKKKKFIRVFWS